MKFCQSNISFSLIIIKKNITIPRMKQNSFFSALLKISVPIMLQSLLQTFINMLDTIMIGRLGSVEIAAVGLGNSFFFVLNMVLFGITSGGGVFIAQFWGKKDIKGIRQSLGIMLFLAVIVSAVFHLLAICIPEQIMRLYSPDPDVIAVGADYLKVVSFSYIITAISFSYTLAFRGTEHVKLPFVATGVSLVVNAVFNYIFIFICNWGVKGAAAATILSRLAEMFILLIVSYAKKYEACGRLRELFSFKRTFVGRFIKIAFPVIVNESFWGLGTSVNNAIFAHAGTDSITAYNIVNTISQLTWVFCMGFGNGNGVIIGKKIGEGDADTARLYANRSLWFMPLVGACVGIFLWPLSKTLPVFFNVSPDIIKMACEMLVVLMIAYPFNSFCMNWIVGVCRAGGDTTFAALGEIIVMWCVSIPLGAIAAFVWHLPAVWIYACLLLSESVTKAILGFIRVKSGKWLHDVTK